MIRRAYPSELYLCTTLVRDTVEHGRIEVDAIVYFDARMTGPGYRGNYYHPPESPEYECTFSTADLDGANDDAPGPLTAIEVQTLRTWFEKQDRAAYECANDNFDREAI